MLQNIEEDDGDNNIAHVKVQQPNVHLQTWKQWLCLANIGIGWAFNKKSYPYKYIDFNPTMGVKIKN